MSDLDLFGYYSKTKKILLVYDISNRTSFDNLNHWIIQIEENILKGAIKVLVGNKSDIDEARQVSYKEGQLFAQSHLMVFFETSAKENKNIKEQY